EGECLLECPPGTDGESWCQPICTEQQVRHQNHCLDACPANTIQHGEACIPGCPEGQGLPSDGVCAPDQCPDGQFRNTDGHCVAECPEGTTANSGIHTDPHCSPQCPEGQFVEFTRCVDACGSGYDVV